MTVTSPSPSIQRHESLYFETLTFLVEDILFKVPRLYFERTSNVFSDMFQLTSGPEPDGSSDQNPISLPPDIKKIDFERLLWAMFPDLNRFAKDQITMGQDGWTSVLKISTLWYMGELRQEAIEELSLLTIDPIVKVLLAREYKVGKWLVEAYTELVKRDDIPTLEESKVLGWDASYAITKVREDTYKVHQPAGQGAQSIYCHNCGYNTATQSFPSLHRGFTLLQSRILDAFREELKNVTYDGDVHLAVALETVPDMEEKLAVRNAIAKKKKGKGKK